MMTSLSGNIAAAAPVQTAPPPAPAALSAPAAPSRATAPDTVTISAAGQQAAHASSDGDSDAS